MITLEEAIGLIDDMVFIPKEEIIDITDSCGKILLEDIFADTDMPIFDKSAVDGYAYREADIDNELTIIDKIQAGEVPKKRVSENCCIKIMTGAMLPAGADAVVMIEDTINVAEGKIKILKKSSNLNICYKAEDFITGEKLLSTQTLISSAHVGIFAMVGKGKIKVATSPKISLIATGNEIVEPYQQITQGQIRNSNSYALISQIKNLGIMPNYMGIIKDSEEDVLQILDKALLCSDLIIFTGGVSMGDYDYVPQILKQKGFDIIFNHIAVQPGKRTLLARCENKFCLGLPGNPVSTFLQFDILGEKLIYKMQNYNYDYKTKLLQLKLAKNYIRKNSDRKVFVPARIIDYNKVEVIEYHGSAHLNALTNANCFIEINIGTDRIEKGELVNVRQI